MNHSVFRVSSVVSASVSLFLQMRPFSRILAVVAPLALVACATVGPPKPPSLELPRPPSDLRAVRKGDKVTLTWTIPTLTTDRETARNLGPTRICRGVESELTQCGTPVGEVAATRAAGSRSTKRTTTFTDTLSSSLQSSGPFFRYAVEVLNQDGHSAGLSNRVRVLSAGALPPFPDFAAEVTGQGVRITWTPPAVIESASGFRHLFRIYRGQEGSATAEKIANLDLDRCGRANPEASTASAEGEQPAEVCPASYLDQTFEWEKTYYYHGTVVTVVVENGKPVSEVEGDDTPEIKVFADDIFPPAVPSGLQVVFSGPGQAPFMDLIWAPVADVDLDGYDVYRHEEGAAPVKINAQLVKAPAYRDASVISGKTYWYSVSAVDVRGNESARSEESSERVP